MHWTSPFKIIRKAKNRVIRNHTVRDLMMINLRQNIITIVLKWIQKNVILIFDGADIIRCVSALITHAG